MFQVRYKTRRLKQMLRSFKMRGLRQSQPVQVNSLPKQKPISLMTRGLKQMLRSFKIRRLRLKLKFITTLRMKK